MKPFGKPYLTVPEQIALLRSRGMAITDPARATAALERIGYYRLSGYWHPLRQSTPATPPSPPIILDDFQAGAEFGQVIDLYVFDKKLRLLILDALERVEVGLRTDNRPSRPGASGWEVRQNPSPRKNNNAARGMVGAARRHNQPLAGRICPTFPTHLLNAPTDLDGC
jgi:hypothetical protein